MHNQISMEAAPYPEDPPGAMYLKTNLLIGNIKVTKETPFLE